ncbi:Gibberellin 3-beta-dioxygenase 1 [Nymphaea thermarum]|nr:Gibberellin 3-beta-dioxygenase 1 [Nymphaea thermarum]
MDLNTMEEVPESYVWPPFDDYLDDETAKNSSIPIISLSEPSLDVLNQISSACEDWGMFQVVNHGVSSQLLSEMESLGNRLFSLPMKQKIKALRAPDGISGYGLARISPFFSKLMWFEGFTIAESSLEHVCCLMPDDYEHFCSIVQEYEHEMEHLARRLMELILSSLGLNKNDVKWGRNGFESMHGVLQLNYYPLCPQPSNAMGLAAHTDSSLLTLLYQTSTQGLQIMKERHWVNVPPVPSAIVINVGDLLHILSNGRFSSPLHRVLVSWDQHRFSFAHFWGPTSETSIYPHPKLLSLQSPPLYQSITWADYLRLKAKLFNRALSSLLLSDGIPATNQ